jgi:antitoxin MazE
MRVFKWEDGLAVLLPKALVDQLGLKEGDELAIVAAEKGRIDVEARETRRQRALASLAERNWTLPGGVSLRP